VFETSFDATRQCTLNLPDELKHMGSWTLLLKRKCTSSSAYGLRWDLPFGMSRITGAVLSMYEKRNLGRSDISSSHDLSNHLKTHASGEAEFEASTWAGYHCTSYQYQFVVKLEIRLATTGRSATPRATASEPAERLARSFACE